MASRNQSKPPPRSPSNKHSSFDEVPLDKRRRIHSGRVMGSTTSSRGRQALAAVNKQDVAVAPSETESKECEIVEFTKEEMEALLNEKIKGKRFDVKGKIEQMGDHDHIKKLKLCLKWFQTVEEGHIEEQGRLKNLLECTERKLMETEASMKIKEEELNGIISELKTNCVSLKGKLDKEERDKLDAIDCNKREKEGRVAAEQMQASLKEELGKAEQDKLAANEKVKSLNELYKRLQESNTSLWGHHNLLQNELTSLRESRDEANKQKEALVKEVEVLRGELHQVTDDRDRQLSQVQGLTAELDRFRERTGKSAATLESVSMKVNALEETCSSQREQVRLLQHQLAAANEKLKVDEYSSMRSCYSVFVPMRSHFVFTLVWFLLCLVVMFINLVALQETRLIPT